MHDQLVNSCISAFVELSRDIAMFANWSGYSLDVLKPEQIQTVSDAENWLYKATKSVASNSGNIPEPLDVLFEAVSLEEKSHRGPTEHVYRLSPMTAESLFPCSRSNKPSRSEYEKLWQEWIKAVRKIPHASKSNFDLWFDHLMSAWLSVAYCLPAAVKTTIEQKGVSLFEDGKVRIARNLCKQLSTDPTCPYLYIQGDFQGIQNFIFTEGSQTNKKSSKLLRGRSFYVSLITELAGLKVLRQLNLPTCNMLMSAAGKFMVLAPNTPENVSALKEMRQEFDNWFIENTYGTCGLSIVWLPASESDFQAEGSHFTDFLARLFEENDAAKLQKYSLPQRRSPILTQNIDYSSGVSEFDARMPAKSPLSLDQILIGDQIVKAQRISVCEDKGQAQRKKECQLSIFGYRVIFLAPEDKDPDDALRVWDISMCKSMQEPIFSGYALRHINGYVSHLIEEDRVKNKDFYVGTEPIPYGGAIEPFECLACEDRTLKDGTYQGLVALGIVKGDVDNLGKTFRLGLNSQSDKLGTSPAAMMELSWRFNSFFAIYLPVLCSIEFKKTYTVFAGGDDFFLIAPWHSAQTLAETMHRKFADFVKNPQIHFSVGIAMTKSKVPPRYLHELAEGYLDQSKQIAEKDSVTVFGESVRWSDWPKLKQIEQELKSRQKDLAISSGYLYKLFAIMDMAENKTSPAASIWRSRLTYNTIRLPKGKVWEKQAFLDFILKSMSEFRRALRIPLSNFLYSLRRF